MDDLIPEFIDETMEGLSLLDNDLVQLEATPENTALLDNAFRVMHTIKGTCGFIGLPRLEKMAHAAENLMEKFRSGELPITERAMTVLFMSVDRVRYIATEIQKHHAEPDGDDADIIAFIDEELATKSEAQTSPVDAPQVAVAQITVDAAPEATRPVDKTSEYLRVHMDVLEGLVNKASELVLTRNQLLQLMPQDSDSPLKLPFNHLCRLVSELQDSVMKARMQPIGDVCAKFPRLIRDLSTELKKKITLEVTGEDTELDRQVLELVKDPLTHMLRNACDHGIESPQERVAAGKPERGTIRLHARHEGGFVKITIADDGRGLDMMRIGDKALEKGIVTPEKLAEMSRKEVLQLIMAPGFSTAEHVSNVSGRGVGMDVVRANIEKIGGLIEMESTTGQGSVFTIHIPLTLAIIPALIVEIDRLKYAIPQLNIQEILSLDTNSGLRVEAVQGKPVLRLRQRIIPLISSAMLFNHHEGRAAQDVVSGKEEAGLVAVVHAGSSQFGLMLDAIHGTEEVVIKSLSPLLRDTGIFTGNTILGDGQVVMILDPVTIARRFHIDKDTLAENAPKTTEISRESAQMLIFRSGDGLPKTLPLELVSRVQVFQPEEIHRSGTQVIAVYQKQMMPLAPVEGEELTLVKAGEVTAVILSDDMSESAMGIVIDEIIGVTAVELDLSTATARSGVLGSLILPDGTTADVLDIAHYLRRNNLNWFSHQDHQFTPFAPVGNNVSPATVMDEADAVPTPPVNSVDVSTAPQASFSRRARGKRVLLVDDSSFFRNLLHPILRSAGYEVTCCIDAVHAIALHDNGEHFDIVLSDIEMPEMNGYAFVERMRQQDSAWRHTPFIAITSHNTLEDRQYGLQKGFDAYIGKLDKDELLRVMAGIRHGEQA